MRSFSLLCGVFVSLSAPLCACLFVSAVGVHCTVALACAALTKTRQLSLASLNKGRVEQSIFVGATSVTELAQSEWLDKMEWTAKEARHEWWRRCGSRTDEASAECIVQLSFARRLRTANVRVRI